MKIRLSRAVTATLLCLCVLTSLSGCVELTMHPATREWKKQQEERMRQIAKEQEQRQLGQQSNSASQGQQKTESVSQTITLEEQHRQAMESQKPIKVGENIHERFAQALLEGDWKGTLEGDWKDNACNDQTAITLRMTTRIQKELWDFSTRGVQKVKGVFRSTGPSQQVNATIIETEVHGEMDLSTGFLAVTSLFSQEEARKLRQEAATGKTIIQFELSRLTADEFHGNKGIALREQFARLEKVEKHLDEQDEIVKRKGALGPLRIDVSRNSDGSGFTGVIAGDGFAGCQILLRSERGFMTDKLPPITREVVLARIQNPRYFYGTNYSGSGYWQHILEKHGKEDDFFLLGEMYEVRGKNFPEHPEYYVRAADYYQKLADKYGDARAQTKLGGLYENGLGVRKNPVKAKQLYALAQETRKKALAVCVTPTIQDFARRMMAQQQTTNQGLEFATAIATGIQLNSGTRRVIGIEAANVVTMEKRFDCIFITILIDPKANADLVPDGYYIEGPYGNIRYESNFIAKATATMAAEFVQKIAKEVPVNTGIGVEPLANAKYRLVFKDQFNKADEIVTVN